MQKYPCLYDKAVSAFHNKKQKKNAWEAVANDIGLETGEAAKNALTSLRTKYVRRKKTLKEDLDFGAIIIFLFGLIF